MATTNRNTSPELLCLCTEQMSREASLLTCAAQAVQSVQAALLDPKSGDLSASAGLFVQFAELVRQRDRFSTAAAGLLQLAPKAATLPVALAQLPPADRAPLAAELHRLRGLAKDVDASTRRLAVFLRIHLDAYRGILRGLTNSRSGSGRYGPTGTAETLDYRPLIQIHG